VARPLIGITTYWVRAWEMGPTRPRGLPEQHMVMSTADYSWCVEAAGGTPVLLPRMTSAEAQARAVSRCDGLVFAGGTDLGPHLYGKTMTALVRRVVPERDEFELALLRLALERGLPLLAICRGLQLLNVGLGGTLFRDLATEHPGEVFHETGQCPKHEPTHPVRLEAGSVLDRAWGGGPVWVNSFHHQGIDALGAGLRPVAWSDDDLVEAVEHPGFPMVLGVQWHPEMMAECHPEQLAPFRLLVEKAANFAGG